MALIRTGKTKRGFPVRRECWRALAYFHNIIDDASEPPAIVVNELDHTEQMFMAMPRCVESQVDLLAKFLAPTLDPNDAVFFITPRVINIITPDSGFSGMSRGIVVSNDMMPDSRLQIQQQLKSLYDAGESEMIFQEILGDHPSVSIRMPDTSEGYIMNLIVNLSPHEDLSNDVVIVNNFGLHRVTPRMMTIVIPETGFIPGQTKIRVYYSYDPKPQL